MSVGLERLKKLYGMVERVRSAEAGLAAAGVAEVAAARAEEERQWWACAAAGAAASGEDRAVQEVAQGAAGRRMGRLREMQVARETLREQAMAAYRESRLQTEQVGRVVARAEVREALEAGRRAQSAADDRYGARQSWVRGMKDR